MFKRFLKSLGACLTTGVFLSAMTVLSVQADTAPERENPRVRLATTTSTDNSGLLKALLPLFQKASGYEVQVIAVGTGKALKMGRDGDVDVVLVHARKAEDTFVKEGHGTKRYPLMYNDFVLIGPSEDPAKIKDSQYATEALTRIEKSTQLFVSRGDDSGTHKKELNLWSAADIEPKGDWYREAGQGMGKVIQMAGELAAYTLTDRGTWLAYQDKSPLTLLFAGDESLFNPYGIIAVSQEKYPDTNHAGAQALIDWLISAEGQKQIGDFKIKGNALFIPSAAEAD